jgi:hypothetical protein
MWVTLRYVGADELRVGDVMPAYGKIQDLVREDRVVRIFVGDDGEPPVVSLTRSLKHSMVRIYEPDD